MSVVNGTFTESALATLQMKITDVANLDNSYKRIYGGYQPVVFNKMFQNQAAKIMGLENENKDQSVKIMWFEQVEGVVTDSCITDCDFTGTEGGSDSQTYSLDACYSKKFKVSEKRGRTNEFNFQEEFAWLFYQNDYEMAKRMETLAQTFVEGNVGTSMWVPSGWTSTSSGIQIADANYTIDGLAAKLVNSKTRNRLINPITIAGFDMYELYFNSIHESLDDDKKNRKSKLDAAGQWVFDLEGQISQDSARPIFQVSPLSYAFATKVASHFPSGAPRKVANDIVTYRLASKFMPGVWYEIKERHACEDAEFNVVHVGMQLKAKFFLNPKSINAPNNTGIVKWYDADASA